MSMDRSNAKVAQLKIDFFLISSCLGILKNNTFGIVKICYMVSCVVAEKMTFKRFKKNTFFVR